MTAPRPPRALAFDVFGTVVDWRTAIARESRACLHRIGRSEVDAEEFANAWRARYQPAMASVRDGRRPFVILDVLHREMLEETLGNFGVDPAGLPPVLLDQWTRAWHRLDPWPDTIQGLARLRKGFPVVTLSNGNIALMLDLARHIGLTWDAILGAEVTRTYKPSAEAYLGTARVLDLAPADLCLVAAHPSDLRAARRSGLLTAYVARPAEGGTHPVDPDQDGSGWDWSATSLTDLADQLCCEPD